MSLRSAKFIRYTLGVSLLIIALNAFGGGYYGSMGAKDIPLEWLSGTIFRSYTIPSLILIVSVGLPCSLSAILVFKRHQLARTSSFLSAIIMLIWIIVQISIIGYVSWMQPAIIVASVIIFILTTQLPRP